MKRARYARALLVWYRRGKASAHLDIASFAQTVLQTEPGFDAPGPTTQVIDSQHSTHALEHSNLKPSPGFRAAVNQGKGHLSRPHSVATNGEVGGVLLAFGIKGVPISMFV